EVHLVDESGAQVLPDGRDAPSDPHVLAASRLARAVQRLADSPGDEMKRRPALHLHRLSRVVGEHERRHVVRRRLAPPARPGVVGPGAADRSEHVAAEDQRPDVLEASGREPVVDAGGAVVLSEQHALKGAGGEHPAHEAFASDAERMLEILRWAGAEAVEGKAEALDTDAGHGWFLRQ